MSDAGVELEAEAEEEVIEEASVIESVDDVGAANGAETVGESIPVMAGQMAEAAAKDAFVEVPVTTEESQHKEDEKTEDQITEIEDEQTTQEKIGASRTSLDEVRDIPVESEEEQQSEQQQQPLSEKEAAAADEQQPNKPDSPTPIARKKVTIEESAAPSNADDSSGSPTRRDPSWWKKGVKKDQEEEEAEVSEAVSIEAEPPAPAQAAEPEAAVVEEAKDESTKEEVAEEAFIEVPVSVEEEPPPPEQVIEQQQQEEDGSKVELEPSVVEEAAKPEELEVESKRAASPAAPREHVSRKDKSDLEERARAAAAYEAAHAPSTAPARSPTYVTYSSWAPASDYRTNYIPTYGSYIRPSLYYHSEYSTPYTRPTSPYVRTFDQYVRVGPFGQSSYATDRLRTRSRSRDRTRYGFYTPPPLRRNREYSMPSRYAQASGPPSAAPSRSGSFVNFMDYIVTTDQKLRRSASRTGSIVDEAPPPVAKTLYPSPADLISDWYDKRISHVNTFTDRLNKVYDHSIYGYYSRYNTSRPFTGYLLSGLGDRGTYSRSFRGHSSDLERRLATHKTYLRAADLTRIPSMTRSIFY